MTLNLSLTPEIEARLRCPRCRSTVIRGGDAYTCTKSGHRWPIVLGIPDFRLTEDPLIPLADDYRKGEVLQEASTSRSFNELVKFYWTLPTYPDTPPDLAARFVHHVVTDHQRCLGFADLLGGGESLLDVGCGAGVLARTMADRFTCCVGVDVGFRWLVVARRGFELAGLPVNLVCANAEHLPFADCVFDTTTSVALLEHVPSADAVLRESARVTRVGGRVFASTTNRFSLTPEPHVRIWGVGFLPRALMPRYVKWRRGLAYDKKHLLSTRELRRTMSNASLSPVRFAAPAVTAADIEQMGAAERFASTLWAIASRVPGVRALLLRVFPVLQAVGVRTPEATR